MQKNTTVSIDDLELPFSASEVMTYHDAAVFEVGDRIVVGYIADDFDCENPLESCDGMGKVLSAHRDSSTHSEMQDALALDSNWDPGLDLVDDHIDQFREKWIAAATDSSEFQSFADEDAGVMPSLIGDYYLYRANLLWDATVKDELGHNESDVYAFEFTDNVRRKLWGELRSDGVVGDKDAVTLDCYEHGGVAWSVSGGGMQCRFDTARGAGVWVPDDCAREEIDRRQAVYSFGRVEDNGNWTHGSGKKRYFGVIDDSYGGGRSEPFTMWHEAFAWLGEQIQEKALSLSLVTEEKNTQERRGRERAAVEIAEGCIETYNDWLNGRTFGFVAATYTNVGDANDPSWEFVDSDECWGCIGDDYAMEEAESNAKAIAEGMTVKAA